MKKLQFVIQVSISILCFIVLSRFIDFDEMSKVFRNAVPGAILVVFIAMIPAVFIRAWRWYFILARKGMRFSLITMYRVTFIGMALNLILPASAGDLVRSYYGWQSHGNKEAMLASAAADKAVALFTLCILGIFCGLNIGAYRIVWLTSLLAIPLAFLLFIPWRLPWNILSKIFKRIVRKDLNVNQLIDVFKMDFSTLVWCMCISLLGWVVTNLMYYFACLAFSPNADLWYIFTIAPLINIMRIIPVTVSGLGSADALIVLLYSEMNVNSAEALAASMIINLFLIALPGLIGAVFMLFHTNRQELIKKTTSQTK